MKTFILLAPICIFACWPHSAVGSVAKEVFQKVSPSVVLIITENEKGEPLALGSGFIIAKGTVASNFHVVRGAASGKARLFGQKGMLKITGISAYDAKRDVVLLDVPGLEAPPIPLRTNSETAVGETIFAIGNPKGLEGTISSGIVSAHRLVGSESVLQITAPISPGSSGGPVVDENSMVVGIATATFKGGQALNFAVPANWLNDLLKAGRQPVSLLKTTKAADESILSSIGEPIINAVGLKYTNRFSCTGILGQLETALSITKCYFSNRSDRTISRILFRVMFFSKDGEMMDFEDEVFEQSIPPGTTRGIEKTYDFAGILFNQTPHRDLSHLKGCDNVRCSTLDFQFSDE